MRLWDLLTRLYSLLEGFITTSSEFKIFGLSKFFPKRIKNKSKTNQIAKFLTHFPFSNSCKTALNILEFLETVSHSTSSPEPLHISVTIEKCREQ